MDDLSSRARSLLDTARGGDKPSATDRRRVQQALAGSLALGAGAAAAAAAARACTSASGVGGAATGVSTVKLAMLVGAGVAVGALGAVATDRPEGNTPVRRDAQHEIREPQAAVLPTQKESAPPEAVPEEPTETAPLHEAPPVVQARGDAPPGPRAAPPASTSSLLAETRLLVAARTAFGRGDAVGALSLLEQHEREYPGGTLVEERIATKVFALCSLRRRDEAAGAAADLLRRAPTSLFRARVLDSCAYDD